MALCVAVLKHLLLTILLLGSVHSYCVSSQAKINQIHFWILVKNFFFSFCYQYLTLCLTVPKLFFFFWVLCPLQSSIVQALNDINIFDDVSQSCKVCGGRRRSWDFRDSFLHWFENVKWVFFFFFFFFKMLLLEIWMCATEN